MMVELGSDTGRDGPEPSAPADFTFDELSPASFLDRAVSAFADRIAIVDGDRRFTYAELHRRVGQLTAALEGLGVGPGNRVAALCANSAVMLELHSALPAHGSVLVPLNIRLSEPELVYISSIPVRPC